MQYLDFSEKAELDRKGAELIACSISELLQKQESVNLAIPGGRSVSGIFSNLLQADVDWNKVHVFMVDERMVPVTDDESNYKLAKDTFLGSLVKAGKLTEKNLHPFRMEKGIAEYEKELKLHRGVYDIILLSSGEDGHVGALAPNHHSIRDESPFFIQMDDSPKPPKDRMTASRKLLSGAKAGILLFVGEGKREAYAKFVDTKEDVVSCPAKIISRIKKAYVLTCFA